MLQRIDVAERPSLSEFERDSAMSMLVETIEQLSTARTTEDIADIVRLQARKLSGADGVAVVVRDGDFCHYVDEDAIGPLWKGLKFPLTACISGWAMLNGETAVIPDIYLDARIPHDAYRPTFVKSLVMTPVRPSEPVAAIGAYWARERRPTHHEIAVLEAVARATAIAFENVNLYASLTEALERRQFLINELDHRVKNTLASVQAIAHQTLRGTPSPEAFVEVFGARLQALSRAHEVLTHGAWRSAQVRDIAEAAMKAFGGCDGARISASGPLVRLGAETAVALQLGLHELAANAANHGALSKPAGTVRIHWDVDMDSEPRTFHLSWRETGGPAVAAPCRRGVGARLIERGLPYAFGGTARLAFEPLGVCFNLDAPLSDRVILG